MNKKILIPIIVIAIIAIGIGAYFIFQESTSQPQPTTQPTTTTPTTPTAPATSAVSKLSLIKKIDIPSAARPEIIVAKDRLFVVYLDISTSISNPSFSVRIYDKDMSREIAYKKLVSPSTQYGSPTDIRVASDGKYLYAFYETVEKNGKEKDRIYLFGAKYTLDDSFTRVAYQGPIAQSRMWLVAQPGDEKLDDPAPMLAEDNVYVMTRYKSTAAKEGETKYKLRKFDKNLNQVSEFDLDLSAYADGEARVASIIYENGYYYIVMQTTTGSSGIEGEEGWLVPSDILMVKLDKNWKVKDSKIIASEPGYTEGYVSGFKSDEKYFYVTYSQVILGKEFSSIMKIYDKNWEAVLTEKYKSAKTGALRPSIEVTADRIYAGNDESETQNANIYIFEKK